MSISKKFMDDLHRGNIRTVAKAISMVENRHKDVHALLTALHHNGNPQSFILGITGAPGAGKSSLVNQLIKYFRTHGRSIGVICIDPNSPATGGALLGDRIRMMEHANDAKVLIRSMSARGRIGGLTLSAMAASRIMSAAGYSLIIIETVGVGQSDIDISNLANLTLLVFGPGAGDDIQFLKTGLSEAASAWVVNKMDLLEAKAASPIVLSEARERNKPVYSISAAHNVGIDTLVKFIDSSEYSQKEGNDVREKKSLEYETIEWAMERLRPIVGDYVKKMKADNDPYILADRAVKKILPKSSVKRLK